MEILTVQATNQEGKKKKQKKNTNANDGKGDTPRMNNQPEGNQEKWKNKYPCKICQGYHPTHLCPHMDDIHQMLSQRIGPQQPSLLTQLFPQYKQMVVADLVPPQGGNQANLP